MTPPLTERTESDKILESLKAQIEAEVKTRVERSSNFLIAVYQKRAEAAENRAKETETRAKEAEDKLGELSADYDALAHKLSVTKTCMAVLKKTLEEDLAKTQAELNEKNVHCQALRAAINTATSTFSSDDLREAMGVPEMDNAVAVAPRRPAKRTRRA